MLPVNGPMSSERREMPSQPAMQELSS